MHHSALVGDARLLHVFQGTCRGVVHSIFSHAVNVITDTDELFVLVHKDGDTGPNVLVVDVPSFDAWQLPPQTAVLANVGTLHLGAQAVTLHNARPWQPPALCYPYDTNLLRQNTTWLSGLALIPGISCQQAPSVPFRQEISQLLISRTEQFVQALTTGNHSEAIRHAKGLLGLGVGLTPSGDDVLLGIFAACTCTDSPVAAWQPLFMELATHARAATGCISSAGLEHAANGQVRSCISAFIEAMLYGTEPDCIRRLPPVLAIGSSSGTDIAYGLCQGFRLCLAHQH